MLDPLHEKCIKEKLIERSKIPIGFTTLPTKTYRPSGSSKVTSRIPLIETTRRQNFFITTQRGNYISTTLPDQESTTFMCTPDSRDIRCIQTQFDYSSQETTTYQNLVKTSTAKPIYEPFCNLYPKHKRCNQRVTDDIAGDIEILTFKPPSPFATVKYRQTTALPKFIPSQKFESILTTESSGITERLNCRDGPYLDPRCPNPTPTGTPPTYLPPSSTQKIDVITIAPRCYPGSLDARCPKITITTIKPTKRTAPITEKITKKFYICVPGSNDVNCDIETTNVTPIKEKPTYIPTLDQYTTTEQPQKPICFIGSTNPECQKVSTDILTFRSRQTTTSIPTTTTARQFITTSRQPTCYFGSLDPRCVQVTTKKVPKSFETTSNLLTRPPFSSTPAIPSSTRAPICYFGSIDPRCVQSTTKKEIVSFGTTTNRAPISTSSAPTPAPTCYPGSLDPRCVQPKTSKVFVSTYGNTKSPPLVNLITTSTMKTAARCYPGLNFSYYFNPNI